MVKQVPCSWETISICKIQITVFYIERRCGKPLPWKMQAGQPRSGGDWSQGLTRWGQRGVDNQKRVHWKILLEIKIAKRKGLSVTVATSERGKWKQSMAWGGMGSLRLTWLLLSLVSLSGVLGAKLCSTLIPMPESWQPVLHSVTVSRGKVFKEVIKLKLKWALIWYDSNPYINKLGHRYTHRGKTRWRHGEGGHLQAEERGFRINEPCWHLDLGLLASKVVKK